MRDKFEIAKENLYSTFSKYSFKSSMEGCPCCVSSLDNSTLYSKPLRELEDEDLSRYAFKAMTTWGDVNDYKHYLPRIFELTATRKLMVETFVTLGKLEYAKWKEWDEQEQLSIIEFLNAWWKYDVNHGNYFDQEVLVELHKYMNNIKTMLNQWNLDIETQGFKNFVEFIEDHYYELAGKNKSFQSLSVNEVKLLKSWAESNIDKLESGFFKYEKKDKAFSEKISNALYTIERMK